MNNRIFWWIFLLFGSLLSFSADKDFLLEWNLVGQCKSILKNSDSEVLQLHNTASLIKDVNINGFSVSLPKLKNKQKKRYIGIKFRIRYYPVQKDNFSKQMTIQDVFSPYRNFSFFISPDKITRVSDFSYSCSIFSKPGHEIYRPELYFSKYSIMYSFRKCAIVYDTQKKIMYLYENGTIFQQNSPVPMNDCVLTFYWYELHSKNKTRTIEISAPTFINTDSLEISLSDDADFVQEKNHYQKNHKNNVDSVFREGLNLIYGEDQDWEKGFRLISSAARKGHALALHEIGICHLRGIAAEQNNGLAKKYLAEAAGLGVLESAYLYDLISLSETPCGLPVQRLSFKGVPFNNPYLNFDLRNDFKTFHKMLKVADNYKIFATGLVYCLKNTNDPLIRKKCLSELQSIAEIPYPPAMLALSKLQRDKEIFYLNSAAELNSPSAVLHLLKKGLLDAKKLKLEVLLALWKEAPEFILYYQHTIKINTELFENIKFISARLNRYCRPASDLAARTALQKSIKMLKYHVAQGDPVAMFFYSRLLLEGDFIPKNVGLGVSLLSKTGDRYAFANCIQIIYLMKEKNFSVDEKQFENLILLFPEDYLPYELYAEYLKKQTKSYLKYCYKAKELGSLKALLMLSEDEMRKGNKNNAMNLRKEYVKRDTLLRNRMQYQAYFGPGVTSFSYWSLSKSEPPNVQRNDSIIRTNDHKGDFSTKMKKKKSKIKFKER